jgi:hypothetical protein
MKKLLLFSFLYFIAVSRIAAHTTEGDSLLTILGSRIDAPATVSFMESYKIVHKMNGIYASAKAGVYLNVKRDIAVSMSVYKQNQLFGSYKKKLPKNLKFDMTMDDVIKMLGKPDFAYPGAGSCGYRFGNYFFTCWFDKGMLRQVEMSYQ